MKNPSDIVADILGTTPTAFQADALNKFLRVDELRQDQGQPHQPQLPTGDGRRKVDPEEAFQTWAAMGELRCYSAVGRHHGVADTTITRLARKERWTERLAKIQAPERAKAEEKIRRSIAQKGYDNLEVGKGLKHKEYTRLDATSRLRLLEDARAGMDTLNLCHKYGVSESAVSRICRKYGIRRKLQRRSYSAEIKEQAQLLFCEGKTVAEISRELDATKASVYNWIAHLRD